MGLDSAMTEEVRAWEYRSTSLVILPDVSFEEWTALWQTVRQTQRSANFWLGDALRHAKDNYPETWTQVLDERGVDLYKSAMWVCSRIPPERRREALSYSAHRETARLDPEEQERWLSAAEVGNWSVAKLKEEMKAEKERLAQYPNNGSPSGADSTWNPPPPDDEDEPVARANGFDRSNQPRADVLRDAIESVRAMAPLIVDTNADDRDVDALSDRVVALMGRDKSLLAVALTDTDQALALKPPGWRIDMEETSGGWAVRLRKDGAQFSLATGPHLPSAIIEACLGAVLSDEAA